MNLGYKTICRMQSNMVQTRVYFMFILGSTPNHMFPIKVSIHILFVYLMGVFYKWLTLVASYADEWSIVFDFIMQWSFFVFVPKHGTNIKKSRVDSRYNGKKITRFNQLHNNNVIIFSWQYHDGFTPRKTWQFFYFLLLCFSKWLLQSLHYLEP